MSLVITSAKEVTFYGACVCLYVCLSANNFMLNYRPDLHENFTRDVSLEKEERVKFRNSSASGSGSTHFLKDSSTLVVLVVALLLRPL